LKFLKVLTWQEISKEANMEFGAVAPRLSRMEGMDGHARSCDGRLKRTFRKKWGFTAVDQPRYD
jgi:sulfopropanediol 3-dehydrogenase